MKGGVEVEMEVEVRSNSRQEHLQLPESLSTLAEYAIGPVRDIIPLRRQSDFYEDQLSELSPSFVDMRPKTKNMGQL